MRRVLEVLIGIIAFPIFVIGGLFYGTVCIYKAFHHSYTISYMNDEF